MAPSVLAQAKQATAEAEASSVMMRQNLQVETKLEVLSYGDTLPGIPKFPTFAAERRHILAHMAAVFRSWMRQGFSEGQAGHISVLDPEYHHLMWMNPWGRHFGTLTAGDMVLVDMATGNIVGRRTVKGGQPRTHNGAGYLLHSSVHTARPDMHAVCHAHTHNGRAWSVFGRPLDMLTKDVCKFHGELAVYNNNGAIVSGREEGDLIAKALGKNRAGILINHGLLTLGHTVDEAGYMFNMLDRSCGIQLAVEAACAGNPALRKHIMPDAEAAWNHDEAVDKDMLYREAQPDISFEFASAGGEHVLAAGADDIVITTTPPPSPRAGTGPACFSSL